MRTKAILTIVISLIVGFILGFLTEGQLVKRERSKWRKISYSQMFENRILNSIEPSESQKEQILPIIRGYSARMNELRSATSKKFQELRNEFNNELKPYLTEEQYKRLTEPRRPSSDEDRRGDHEHRRPPQPDGDRK